MAPPGGSVERLYRGPAGRILDPIARRVRGRGFGTRYPILWKAHRLIWRATGTRQITALGHVLELDPLDSMRLASGAYEPAETQWYEGNVRTGDLVVELGANIGYFTLLFARLVGPTGAVRAYEPDPVLTQILERNVARNGYGNIEVRTAAVSDRTGRARFYRSHENLGDNRLFSHGDDAAVFDVDCVSLDDEFRDVPQTIGVVKMDIQGAEPAAWRGMRRLLATNPPRALLIEFWPHGISGMGEDSAAFLRAIAAAGYSIREIDKAEHVEVSELVSRLTPENRLWVNLVCERSASNESVGQ